MKGLGAPPTSPQFNELVSVSDRKYSSLLEISLWFRQDEDKLCLHTFNLMAEKCLHLHTV